MLINVDLNQEHDCSVFTDLNVILRFIGNLEIFL